jgi:hypothetical protein
VLVTRRGRPVARLSAAESRDPLTELAERGLVRLPQGQRSARQALEDGSELASELWSTSHPAAASMLVHPEGRAALAAARRNGRLGKREHARALAGFEDLVSDLALIGVDEPLARSAGDLAEEFELRGCDAVHLATALALGKSAVTLVTWDGDLADAAVEARLPISPA